MRWMSGRPTRGADRWSSPRQGLLLISKHVQIRVGEEATRAGDLVCAQGTCDARSSHCVPRLHSNSGRNGHRISVRIPSGIAKPCTRTKTERSSRWTGSSLSGGRSSICVVKGNTQGMDQLRHKTSFGEPLDQTYQNGRGPALCFLTNDYVARLCQNRRHAGFFRADSILQEPYMLGSHRSLQRPFQQI